MEDEEGDDFWVMALAAEEDTIRKYNATRSTPASEPPVQARPQALPTPADKAGRVPVLSNAGSTLVNRNVGSVIPPGGNQGQHPQTEDSFSRILREKDDELRRLSLAKDGEIANQRHKIRALQSQVEAQRSLHVPAPPSSETLERVTAESAQHAKEAAVAKADVARLSEQLVHMEHELNALKEQDKRRGAVGVAPLAASSGETGVPNGQSNIPAPSRRGGVLSAAFPEPGMLGSSSQVPCTGVDVVEGTQFNATEVAYDMALRRPQKPRTRRRLDSDGDPASSVFSASQPNGSSHNISRQPQSAEEMPPPPPRQRVETPVRKRGRPRQEVEPEVQVVLLGGQGRSDVSGFDFSVMEFDGDARALREALFGEGRAEQLLQLCSSLNKKDLRASLTSAMASNDNWTALLVPLSELCQHRPNQLALTAICALTEYSKTCRTALATSCAYESVMDNVLSSLESATETSTASLACLCLRIMSCIVSEISLLEDGDVELAGAAADKPEFAVAMRRRLEHEAVLVWLQQHEPEKEDACEAAAEIASDLIMNIVGTHVAQTDQREGDFLEQAVLCFAAVLPLLTISTEVKTRALCALDWTSQVAPYLLYEADAKVMESLCVFFVEVVHHMRVRAHLERKARSSFCELLEGSGTSAGHDSSRDQRDAEEHDYIADAIPQCWEFVKNFPQDPSEPSNLGGVDAQIAAVRRALAIARRLVQKGPAGVALLQQVEPATRNVAVGTLAFLGWPDTGESAQYPVIYKLHEVPSLASDSRIVYEALLRAERAV